MASIHIGTSGWHYAHWQDSFYPADLPAEEWLAFYARRFATVEVNNTFYQLPEPGTLDQWRDTVPAGFQFAVKASRYITHLKKLKDPHQPVGHFLELVQGLQNRLGPVLFQLPPNWHLNLERLHSFLQVLPSGGTYAFEFRDPSWFDARVYDLLAEFGVAFCIHDMAGRPSPKTVTAGTVYIRLHGPGGQYQGSYDHQALAGWAGALTTWWRQGHEIYCYFNNDQQGYAPANALALLPEEPRQELLDGRLDQRIPGLSARDRHDRQEAGSLWPVPAVHRRYRSDRTRRRLLFVGGCAHTGYRAEQLTGGS
jgi:uncharacterized protein YecE (DUF72 family)